MKQMIVFAVFFPFMVICQPNHLVISQVYGGGGNAGASYTNDFIELFNPASQVVDLSGYSVQYSSSAGTTWNVIALTGLIQPRKYYLIQLSGGLNGAALPLADQVSSLNLSASSGKIMLVQGITAASGSCPSQAGLIDVIGYGTANCFENQAAPAGSNSSAVKRKGAGCIDTDNNSQDFISGTPLPKNSGSAETDCATLNTNLPVYFTNESAKPVPNGIQVSWTNEIETEVEHYYIESSHDGIYFQKIETILPQKNDGTKVDYQFSLPGKSGGFYRISAMESNGTETFSKVLHIKLYADLPGILIFPNPISSFSKLQIKTLEKGVVEIIVADTEGRILKNRKTAHPGGIFNSKIEAFDLKPGAYILIVYHNGQPAGRIQIFKTAH